jgi:hypothetical protein
MLKHLLISAFVGVTSVGVIGCDGLGGSDTSTTRAPTRDSGDVVISKDRSGRSSSGDYDHTRDPRDTTYDRSRDSNQDRTSDRIDRDNADRASDRISDRDLPSAERLPANATQVGEKLTLDPDTGIYYKAERDGTVYVYDSDRQAVVFSTHVNRGQKFWLNLTREKATVAGRVVYEGNLRRADRYELYVVPDSTR